MKKELFVHFAFCISLVIFVTLTNGWFSLIYWPFWAGAFLGTLLPDIDHLLYVFFLKPQELTSQRVGHMLGKKDIVGSLNLLAETRGERTKLVFHSATFQLIFWILTFFVITSSSSLLGLGLVLAFALHLLVDQAVDLFDTGSLDNWFKNFPLEMEVRKQKIFLWVNFILLLIFSFIL